VVFVDSYSWQSFADLAGALRHRGIPAARITGRAASPRQRAVMALESLVYGPSVQLVDGGALAGRPATISPGALAMAVGPTTRDVQMQDDLVIPALDSGPCAANPLRRVAPGVDPMVLVDKRLQEESARHAGVPVPESWPTRETAQLPAVVKPAVGFGGDDVTVVHDADALDRAWREVVAKHGRPPVVQRLLAQGMSTAGVATHGEPVLLLELEGNRSQHVGRNRRQLNVWNRVLGREGARELRRRESTERDEQISKPSWLSGGLVVQSQIEIGLRDDA